MAILIFASAILLSVAHSGNQQDTLWIFSLCSYLRTAGFMEVILYLYLYESFHQLCVSERERQMAKAGLSTSGMHFSQRSARRNMVDYIIVPICASLYGSIPCAHAQICHFWTLDFVYTVSGKMTRRQQQGQQQENRGRREVENNGQNYAVTSVTIDAMA